MQKPVMDFRIGCVEVAVWEKTVEHEGRTATRYHAKFNRRYKDRQSDEWKDTQYFDADDLMKISLLAQRVAERLLIKERDLKPAMVPSADDSDIPF